MEFYEVVIKERKVYKVKGSAAKKSGPITSMKDAKAISCGTNKIRVHYTDTGRRDIFKYAKHLQVNSLGELTEEQDELSAEDLKVAIYGPIRANYLLLPEYRKHKAAHQQIIEWTREMKRAWLKQSDIALSQLLKNSSWMTDEQNTTDAELDSMKLADFGITKEEFFQWTRNQYCPL